MLERAGFDVLLLLDCCHAAAAVTKGCNTMEILAGCGRESIAAGPSGEGGSPFTSALIKHLSKEETQLSGLLISELQTMLSYDEILKNQSPNHVVVMGHRSPINLKPLVPETKQKKVEITTSQSQIEVPLKIDMSLLCLAVPDSKEFIRWLTSQPPKEIALIEVEKVLLTSSVL
jgi:hypothetical protein